MAAALVDEDEDERRTGAATPRRRALVVLAALVAAGVVLHALTWFELRATDAAAARARDAAAVLAADNDVLDVEAADLAGRLWAAEQALANARDARRQASDALRGEDLRAGLLAVELDRLEAELAGLGPQVESADREAAATGAVVAALSGCLTGVSQFLNQLSVGDERGALGTADRIEAPCAAVGVVVG